MKSARLLLGVGLVAFALISQLAAAADTLTVQDYFDIQQLYAKYNDAIDSGDAEGYASTFTANGVFMDNVGHDALVTFVKQWHERMNGAKHRHWNTNLRVSGNSTHATGSVYLMLLDISSQPATIMSTASYTDDLVKTANGWRFTKRVIRLDGPPPAPLPAK
jgi:ketosteroid isomerase-like protein